MFAANEGVTPNDKLYVDDVFSTYLYTGNGSTQTITNGIDLSGKGGLVWIKSRSTTNSSHALIDTSRGNRNILSSNSTLEQLTAATSEGVTAFNADGFSLGTNYSSGIPTNTSAATYASWTFRKQPKFFDVVTYTGNGTAGRQIAHNLGSEPGCIIVKATNSARSWVVYHRSTGATQYLLLERTDAAGTWSGAWNNTAPTSTNFTVGTAQETNGIGNEYVAYLFAHDTASDGLIQCGSFTTDGSGNATVTLGWEPQFVLIKTSSSAGNWIIHDAMRGMAVAAANQPDLQPNTSAAESASTSRAVPSATGFAYNGYASSTLIYLAIRRPNKPPTTGTSVFSPNLTAATTGTAVTTGFPVDLQIQGVRPNYGLSVSNAFMDRLRGLSSTATAVGNFLAATSTNAEVNNTTAFRTLGMGNTGYNQDGYLSGTGAGIYWNFRRAPGFFDVVCYTGDGTTSRNISHSLGVFPELVIVKRRSTSGNWWVDHDSSGAEKVLYLDSTNAAFSYTAFGTHTATKIQLETVAHNDTNQNTGTYVAYLFASMPGISKVGSYTGNGTSQTINCGFTTGARFILIKRTDSTGDWYVWDSARGIVAANDPHLSLNTTATEVTTNDSVDPDSSGFIVNQNTATNINVSGASYIFLAIA